MEIFQLSSPSFGLFAKPIMNWGNAVIKLLALLVAPTLAFQVPLVAQSSTDAAPDQQVQICLSVSVRWMPTDYERALIETIPVPESFRRHFGWQFCNHLDKRNLLDWHIKEGSAESAGKALEFLEESSVGTDVAELSLNPTEKLKRYAFLAHEYERAAKIYRTRAFKSSAARYRSLVTDAEQMINQNAAKE